MKKELWEHQKYALEKYKNREYFGLLFDMGLGKTLTVARIAEEKEKPVLIIAPNCLCEQWKEELENKNEDRITTKDWNVLLCTSETKKTKKFKKDFEDFLKD